MYLTDWKTLVVALNLFVILSMSFDSNKWLMTLLTIIESLTLFSLVIAILGPVMNVR